MSFTPQSLFLRQQLDHVLNLAFQETFPVLKARNFIPVNRSIPPAAETLSARIWDTYGEAKVLNPNADDFPSVSVGQREAYAPIKSLGCYFEYSVLDLRRSELAGSGLDSKLATAARQTIESKIDLLATHGDDRAGIRGLCNQEITSHNLGKWFDEKGKSLKSPEHALADINLLVSSIAEDTNNVLLPDTLLLPVKHFSYLAQTPFSAHSQVTILNYLLSNNPYIKNVDSWVHLKNQCVLYPRTPQALEMYIPLEFEMLEPQAGWYEYPRSLPCPFWGCSGLYAQGLCLWGRFVTKAFLARFPEFAESLEDGDQEIIALMLRAAETELNPSLWGNLFEEGVFYLADDKLMRSRLGEDLRDPDDPAARSVYAIEFERLCRVVSMGARVV